MTIDKVSKTGVMTIIERLALIISLVIRSALMQRLWDGVLHQFQQEVPKGWFSGLPFVMKVTFLLVFGLTCEYDLGSSEGLMCSSHFSLSRDHLVEATSQLLYLSPAFRSQNQAADRHRDRVLSIHFIDESHS